MRIARLVRGFRDHILTTVMNGMQWAGFPMTGPVPMGHPLSLTPMVLR